jgi:hypothetical protein
MAAVYMRPRRVASNLVAIDVDETRQATLVRIPGRAPEHGLDTRPEFAPPAPEW